MKDNSTRTIGVIIGLGVTGLSCARFLVAQGMAFVVVDSRESPPNLKAFRKVYPDVQVYCGGWHLEVLLGATQLLVSPGVSLEENVIASAIEAGIPVVSDIDLFRMHLPGTCGGDYWIQWQEYGDGLIGSHGRSRRFANWSGWQYRCSCSRFT